ncbi:MAG: hypothetical protein GY778_08460 [bacterium]|nr:hypothetical protein [bacterium]
MEGDYAENSALASAHRWETGGLGPEDVAVAANGDIWMDYNTEGMARAAANSKGRFEVLIGDEKQAAK